MLSKASKRCQIDGVGRGERILHLHTRRAVDDEACGLQYFEKSRGKVRAKQLQMVHNSGGVLEALIDVADLSIITDHQSTSNFSTNPSASLIASRASEVRSARCNASAFSASQIGI